MASLETTQESNKEQEQEPKYHDKNHRCSCGKHGFTRASCGRYLCRECIGTKICSDCKEEPSSQDLRTREALDNPCAICFDSRQMKEQPMRLLCGHWFCAPCISKLTSDKCPMCRSEEPDMQLRAERVTDNFDIDFKTIQITINKKIALPAKFAIQVKDLLKARVITSDDILALEQPQMTSLAWKIHHILSEMVKSEKFNKKMILNMLSLPDEFMELLSPFLKYKYPIEADDLLEKMKPFNHIKRCSEIITLLDDIGKGFHKIYDDERKKDSAKRDKMIHILEFFKSKLSTYDYRFIHDKITRLLEGSSHSNGKLCELGFSPDPRNIHKFIFSIQKQKFIGFSHSIIVYEPMTDIEIQKLGEYGVLLSDYLHNYYKQDIETIREKIHLIEEKKRIKAEEYRTACIKRNLEEKRIEQNIKDAILAERIAGKYWPGLSGEKMESPVVDLSVKSSPAKASVPNSLHKSNQVKVSTPEMWPTLGSSKVSTSKSSSGIKAPSSPWKKP
jgi:hypothetical protein